MRRRSRSAASFLLLCGLSMAFGTGCVEHYFYHPVRSAAYPATPADHGLRFEPVSFSSADGTRLEGWFLPAAGGARQAAATIVHIHGNAGNMSSHFPLVSWLTREQFNVFVFDYRGYGRSEGRPNRHGLIEDALAAIQNVAARDDVDPRKLVVYGQSLGGAIAINAIGGHRDRLPLLRAVVIESTFASYRSIVRDQAELVGLGFLAPAMIGNRLSPEDAVGGIAPVPLLIVHGEDDAVISVSHARPLYAAAVHPKSLWLVPGAGHLSVFSPRQTAMRRQLVRFIRQEEDP